MLHKWEEKQVEERKKREKNVFEKWLVSLHLIKLFVLIQIMLFNSQTLSLITF